MITPSSELCLPTMRQLARSPGEQSDREGWPASRCLSALAEHELAATKLRPGQTLASFDFSAITGQVPPADPRRLQLLEQG